MHKKLGRKRNGMESDRILGTWKLSSFEYRTSDGTHFCPYGERPIGFLIYNSDGYMSGMIAKSDRPELSTESPNEIPEHERCRLSDGYLGYSGKYEIQEDKIIHYVEVSFIPNLIGQPLERYYRFYDNNILELSTPVTEFSGKEFIGYITWKKI